MCRHDNITHQHAFMLKHCGINFFVANVYNFIYLLNGFNCYSICMNQNIVSSIIMLQWSCGRVMNLKGIFLFPTSEGFFLNPPPSKKNNNNNKNKKKLAAVEAVQ